MVISGAEIGPVEEETGVKVLLSAEKTDSGKAC